MVVVVIEPLVHGSPQPLAARHDVALLDLDGVLYVGTEAVPGAPGAVRAAAAVGLRPAYVTNNAARTPTAVAGQLRSLGLPVQDSDVVTSAQAAARLVADRVQEGAQVLVVGGEGLLAALTERGLVAVGRHTDDVAAVAQGFGPEVGWRLLAEGTYAVAAGRPWIASNLDATIPTPRGRAPGNGALVDVIAAATGRRPDAVAGKPEAALHQESVQRTRARQPLVVGDRLDTDIEGANRAGTPSLFVLTGVDGPRELLRAVPARRPSYLAVDLPSGLLRPHPPVEPDGAGWRCGQVSVRVRGGQVSARGTGQPVDRLRALCVAWWSAAAEPDDTTDGAVTAALRTLGW